MSDIVERLRDYKEKFIFQGASKYALGIADEIERLRSQIVKLEKVREAAEAWRADMALPVDHLRTCQIHIRMLSALLGMKA
jgi:hypothetical protein